MADAFEEEAGEVVGAPLSDGFGGLLGGGRGVVWLRLGCVCGGVGVGGWEGEEGCEGGRGEGGEGEGSSAVGFVGHRGISFG